MSATPKEPKPWESPQKTETPKQFAAFRCYLSMGEKRSCAAVGKALGKSAGLIERWCALNGWRERVSAFEAHATTLAAESEAKTLALAAVDWGKRLAEQREKEWQDAQLLRAKAAEILSRATVKGSITDAVRALSVASELERRSMNLPTSQVDHGGAVAISGANVQVIFPDNFRDKPQPPAECKPRTVAGQLESNPSDSIENKRLESGKQEDNHSLTEGVRV